MDFTVTYNFINIIIIVYYWILEDYLCLKKK